MWIVVTLTVMTALSAWCCVSVVQRVRTRRNVSICPWCKYPESASQSRDDVASPCSECGLSWSDAEQRDICRLRRLLAVACVSISITVTLMVAAIRTGAILNAAPDIMLANASTPMIEPDHRPVGEEQTWMERELFRRIESGTLSKRAHARFAQRVIDHGLAEGKLIGVRETWPAGVPIRMHVGGIEGLSVLGDVEVQIAATDGQILHERLLLRQARISRQYNDSTVIIPDELVAADGRLQIVLRVIEAAGDRDVLASATVENSIRFVDSLQWMLQGVDEDISRYVKISDVSEWYSSRDEVMHTIVHVYKPNPYPPEFAIGVRVEIVCNDEVLALAKYLYKPPSRRDGPMTELIKLEYPLEGCNAQRVVRITPDPEIALRDMRATQFWNGEPVVVELEMSAQR